MKSITRERACEAIASLGFDPDRVRSITLSGAGVDVVLYAYDERGRRTYVPDSGVLCVAHKMSYAGEGIEAVTA